jgi:hypothetical protein
MSRRHFLERTEEMTKNVGQVDRLVRAAVAIVALIIAWNAGFSGALGIIALVVGIVMAVTAAVGTCPLYRLVGVNTCKVKS